MKKINTLTENLQNNDSNENGSNDDDDDYKDGVVY